MFQLRRFLIPLVALSGALPSLGTQANISVVNKVIAPDGYSRL